MENNDTGSPFYFCKEDWLLHNIKDNIPAVLKVVFTWYNTEDFETNLYQWLQQALCNDDGVYKDNRRGANLVKFYGSLLLLIKDMDYINNAQQQKLNNSNNTAAINNLFVDPPPTVKQFCTVHTPAYASMELWDWLDAALSNKDFYKNGIDRSLLLLTYRCIMAFIQAAFLIPATCDTQAGQYFS